MRYLTLFFITYIVVLSTGCGGTRQVVSNSEMEYLKSKKIPPSSLVNKHQAYIRINGEKSIELFLLPDSTSKGEVKVPVIKISTTEKINSWILYDNTKCVISSATTSTMKVQVVCDNGDCDLGFEEQSLPEIEGDDSIKTFRLTTTSLLQGNIVSIDGEEVECVGIKFNEKTYICTNEDWRKVFLEIKTKEKSLKEGKAKNVKGKRVNPWYWPFSWPKN